MRISLFDKVLFQLLAGEVEIHLKEDRNARYGYISPEENLDFELSFKRFNPIVEKFVSTFQKNFTGEQTRFMMYRLKYLKIKERQNKLEKIPPVLSLGNYNSEDNEITIEHYNDSRIEENEEDTLIHELMHMASTRSTSRGHVTGLELPDILGMNLNEGYTEYLTEKYFTRGMKYVESRNKNVLIAKGIENIIGKENMQEAYFSANLGLLISDLEPYASRRDIIKLLFLIDRYDKPFHSEKKFQDIIGEIARLNKRKLDILYERGEITREEYQIEYAIKVSEYRNYRMWSEETKVVKDENCFMLLDQGYQSNLFEFRNPRRAKYQKN